MKIKFSILLFLLSSIIYSQVTKTEQLAAEYYKKGDFLNAASLFEEIYKQKKVKTIYSKYIDCLIKIQSYKKAEKTIKGFYKKKNDPTILIDLGELYIIQGDPVKGREKFEAAINEAKKNTRFLPTVSSKFMKIKQYEFALKGYSIAKQKNDKASYSLQIANIYSYLGEIEKMYNELIQILYKYPNYFQTCKNKLRITISDDGENENNKKLKKTLIKSIQKKNSYEVSKLIVWLFMQEKKFQDALDYEISIDKRISDNQLDIIQLGDIAVKNGDLKTAENAFQYILKNNHENSYYYEYSSVRLLDIEFETLISPKIKKRQDIEQLANKHKLTLDKLGVKTETISTLKNYCEILAIYLDKQSNAIEILQNAIQNSILDPYDIAICKMELAKIWLQNGNIWESTLLYAQVEKEFNEDVIGQKAKFEKTKINYYKGDFKWAQNQLKVLKLSTSKLIANNAMKLSLLISDNLNLDTSETALLLYAKAELLFNQKQYSECLAQLKTLKEEFPGHSLIDEVLLKEADVFIEKKEYENAIRCLNKICEEYYYDILYDDALFYQAQIYEHALNETNEAKKIYEKMLLKTPNSIFINEARNRYKMLRQNNFLQLQ